MGGRSVLSWSDRSEDLESVLEEVLSSTDALASLGDELGLNAETDDKDDA